MWDFSFEIPSLLLLASVLVYYFSNRRLPVRRGRIYVLTIVLCALCATTNMLGSMFDVGIIDHFPGHMGKVMNYVYYCSYMLRFFSLTLYFLICTGQARGKKLRLGIYTAALLSEIWTVCAVAGGFFYYQDATGLHLTRAYYSFFNTLTIATAGIQLLILLRAVRRKTRIEAFWVLLVCIGLEVVIALSNTYLPELLISDPMYMTIVLYLLVAIENPASLREPGTSSFNVHAFSQMLESGEIHKWHLTAVMMNNYRHIRSIYSSSAFYDALREMDRYLVSRKNTCVFSLQDDLVLLMTRDPADELISHLIDRSAQAWKRDEVEIYFDFSFLKVRPEYLPAEVDEFTDYIRSVLDQAKKNEIHELGAKEIAALHRRNSVRSILDTSVREGTVQMFLQPIVNARTGKLEGAEALARLYDPYRKEYISPVEFIPLAEESGLVIPLGRQMLEKACAFLREEGDALAWINVNVSPTQFADRGFFTGLSHTVESAGLSYDRVHLEITEEAYLSDHTLTQELSFARDKRYQIVLDDFGTGYSSLSRVVQNPFSNIKLDMQFVWDSLKGEKNILPELIQAFHKLGYTVTAEGVETGEMAQTLTAYGCDYLQGYLYSAPVPVSEFRKLELS